MVIYPVILHGDTALPPACLISKLWLWCFKLYTQRYVFNSYPVDYPGTRRRGFLEVFRPHGILTALKVTLGNVTQFQIAILSVPYVVWACLTQDVTNLYH